jgi:Holliday junction resolvase-like predicted endonuclease
LERSSPIIERELVDNQTGTTAEHPFYVAGENRFVPAGELTLEDQLVDSQGRPIAIDAIRVTDRLINVYNFRVGDHHTYFVGGKLWQFDAWVHNSNYNVRAFAGERQARTLLEKRNYEILATLSNRNGNGLDIIATNQKGKLRFFEVKTTQNGDIGLSPAQSKGSQAYVWQQLQLAAGNVKQKQEWRWADGNLRGSHVRGFAQDLIDELDDLAGGKGKGKTAIQGHLLDSRIGLGRKTVAISRFIGGK